MTKDDLVISPNNALRTIEGFDVSKIQAALRIDNSMDDFSVGLSSGSYAENVAVITKNTVIDGDIRTKSPVSVKGTVNGSIDTESDAGINGIVNGDVTADNIDVTHAALRGNATAQKEINVTTDSVVIGDVSAEFVTIDGKVKGDIQAKQRALFKSKSLVVGSITAGNFNMEEGSRLNATITITSKTATEFDDSEFSWEV